MNVLDQIMAAKRQSVAERKTQAVLQDAIERARDAEPVRGFQRALETSDHHPSLIAEVKKASPVKGIVREPFDAEEVAMAYRNAGADCLSVLTDCEYFQGSVENLQISRRISGLPVLRKDFTTDELDVYEARAMGADAVLLIMAGLDDNEVVDLLELSTELGMDTLVEAHTLEEGERAVSLGATLVGLNNRDLATFETDLNASAEAIPKLARQATVVSESALKTFDDIQRVAESGARSVLIGTAFCAAPDIEGKVREVMGWPSR